MLEAKHEDQFFDNCISDTLWSHHSHSMGNFRLMSDYVSQIKPILIEWMTKRSLKDLTSPIASTST
jgi:hypothetical protein